MRGLLRPNPTSGSSTMDTTSLALLSTRTTNFSPDEEAVSTTSPERTALTSASDFCLLQLVAISTTIRQHVLEKNIFILIDPYPNDVDNHRADHDAFAPRPVNS